MDALGPLTYVFAFLLLLTPIVFIHEFGHYWVARRNGVIVDAFSIGFGPELWHRIDKNGTRWRIGALPLGGYVKMRGDENAASMTSESSRRIKGSFASASLPARMAIVAAGPAANFITGILIFAFIYMGVGKLSLEPVVGDVFDNSPAAVAGLQAGDIITAIDGSAVSRFNDVKGLVSENPNRSLIFEINRDGRLLDLPVVPEERCSEEMRIKYGYLGVQSTIGEMRQLGFAESLWQGAVDSFALSAAMLRGIGRMVTGQVNEGEIGGPVKIAKISGDAMQAGWINFTIIIALLSINLGLVNLLPVPALDGGHLMLFTIEAILRRPLSDKIQGILMRIGTAFLMSLMLVLILYDSYSALVPEFCT